MMYFALICSSISKSSKQAVEGSNPSAITTLSKPRLLAWFFYLRKSQTCLSFGGNKKTGSASCLVLNLQH